ncbi:hypothetical protein SS1G_11682 [Sclerotinia sclerotiorum 1980 UF-70]|uniref:HTH psq-type domain-containing protein n=1 Tax=Sclerotinia sclerotiorum (strain ATCC 18683 / 1980 / Ss-1) TaxID=665079 RepID=A7F261_SCLS1|nr:hypothetical protein SS1G_11682 [Sclerotinia sclerotiorum 1980 UF-70]EDN95803.1 hypothetical protein SS1G_11682 [Sclerotinia sclerotiorum 1980 UF-70]
MQESQINLAIQAIASSKKLSVRRAAKIYNIPHTTLTYRIAGRTPKAGSRSIHCKMTELEEKSLFQYIIDMDERGFSPRISDVEDMANYILETRDGFCWYEKDTEDVAPTDYVGPTDDETGIEWIKHFNKHTESRKMGRYRMLVLDGHESHKSPAFQEYCKKHNIILLSLPPHSSHLTQPLNIDCFGPLKRSYNRQIENFIKAHITHITKTEFFQTFKAAYIEAISISNELLAHANTLLTAEVHSLRKANEALSKRRRARKALIRKRRALSIEDRHGILEQENVEDQIQRDEYTNDNSSARRQATIQQCSKCGSTLHNARTCQFDPALVDL